MTELRPEDFDRTDDQQNDPERTDGPERADGSEAQGTRHQESPAVPPAPGSTER